MAAGPVSRILSAGGPAGRSFLWAAHYCTALATYPEVGRAEQACIPPSPAVLSKDACQTRHAQILRSAKSSSLRMTKHSRRRRELPPYLVLLRVGFALPAALLSRRCALTAPFHPYPGVVLSASEEASQARNIAHPKHGMHRAARPDPSLSSQRFAQDDKRSQRRRGGMFSVALSVDRA